MCGVAGIVSLDGREVALDPLHTMLDRLRHRGPDDSGTYAADGIALGNRRLSVIDIEGGHQPMRGARESTMRGTNGEISN